MFSLIITLISIALVAALALATLYYGGDAYNNGRADAAAAKIRIQAQQLQAVSDLYYVHHGIWPSPAQMLADGYLTAVPIAQTEVMGDAQALAQEWEQAAPNQPVYLLKSVEAETCRRVNRESYQLDGILPQALTRYPVQCYGETLQTLTAVVAKNSSYLVAAGDSETTQLPPADVSPDPLPEAGDTGAWTAPPTAAEAEGEAPPPVETDAAACLSTTQTTDLLLTPDQNQLGHSPGFGLYNTCTRPMVARAYDQYAANEFFVVNNQTATIQVNSFVVHLPSVYFGPSLSYSNPPTMSETGALDLTLYANMYFGAYVAHKTSSSAARGYIPLTVVFPLNVPISRATNVLNLEVKFADEPDTAFVPKSFPISVVSN